MLNNSARSLFKFGVRQKVIMVLITVLLSALTITGWIALQEEEENLLKEVQQRGSDISRFVAKSLAYSVIGYDYHTIDLLLDEITHSDDVGYVRVMNLKGNTMAESGKILKNDPTKMVIFNEKIFLNGEIVGNLILGLSTDNIHKHLEVRKYSLIKRESLIILLIAIGEMIALSFIIIKPISVISRSLPDKDGPFLGTIPLKSNDEFGELAKQFNELSQNLNIANAELQSRVDFADKELIKTNNVLLKRSIELSELNKEFEKLSVTDSLTGLYNRRYFEQKLEEEIESTRRYGDTSSLLIIDIDHFKLINDNHGHSHGDTVIKMVSACLKQRFRETDIVCRIGGEEFVVICKRADKNNAIELAEDMRKKIEKNSLNVSDNEIKVTISIGIATVCPEKFEDERRDLFKHADSALYYGKAHGRNCVFHYDDIKEIKELKETTV